MRCFPKHYNDIFFLHLPYSHNFVGYCLCQSILFSLGSPAVRIHSYYGHIQDNQCVRRLNVLFLGLVKMTAHYYMINHRLTRPLVYEGQAVAQIRIKKQANHGQTFLVCHHEQRILNVRSNPPCVPTAWLPFFRHPPKVNKGRLVGRTTLSTISESVYSEIAQGAVS